MRIKSVLAAVSVTGIALAGFVTSPASGALVTRCIGTAGAVTVPGDLVIPAGKSCTLNGTIVEGKTTIRAGADLVISDGDLKGNVTVAENGYFDAYRTKVGGNVTTTGAYGVYFDESSVAGGYTGRAGKSVVPFVYVGDSTVAQNVTVNAGETLVDGSTVDGAVSGTGGSYLDVVNSTLNSTLTVAKQSDGATICASEVYGNASWTQNKGVQIGTGSLLSTCDDVNYFGADVMASNNTVGVAMNGNIVRGNVSGTGNNPAPTGSGNRVRGTLSGQFANLAPASTRATAQRKAATVDRTAVVKGKGADRKSAATAAAAKAGPTTL